MTPAAWRRWTWVLPPAAVGLGLRLLGLREQILGGDEIHAVRFAGEMRLREILVTYQPSDYCQPLTAFYRLGRALGIEWTEMGLRLPILAAALVFLLAAPRIVEKALGRRAATWLAWLLALSPLLVLYGRIVRSYAPAVLLSGLAAAAFWAWWRGAGRLYSWAFVVLAPLTLYVHLVTAPMLAAPFVFAAGELLIRRQPGRRGRDLLRVGLGTLAGIALFLVPSWASLRAVLEGKQADEAIPPETGLRVLLLQAGTASVVAAAVFWLLAVAGLVVLLRGRDRPGDRRLGLYTLVLAGCQTLGVLAISPLASHIPVVLNRYLLVLTPVVLLWLAAALAHPWTALRGHPRVQDGLGVVVLAVLVLAGPLAEPGYRRSSFIHSDFFLEFHVPRPHLDASLVPTFYLDLARDPDGRPLVEVPGIYYWRLDHGLALYQEYHGRPVILAVPWADYLEGYAFRRMLNFRQEEILATPARYLVLHRRAEEEYPGRVRQAGAPPRMNGELHRVLGKIGEAARAFAGQLGEDWGPPAYEDEWISVWDLDAVRAASAK